MLSLVQDSQMRSIRARNVQSVHDIPALARYTGLEYLFSKKIILEIISILWGIALDENNALNAELFFQQQKN